MAALSKSRSMGEVFDLNEELKQHLKTCQIPGEMDFTLETPQQRETFDTQHVTQKFLSRRKIVDESSSKKKYYMTNVSNSLVDEIQQSSLKNSLVNLKIQR